VTGETDLSDDLRLLLDFELANGNAIHEVHPSVDGSGPPLFISLKRPFRYRAAREKPALSDTLEWKVIDDRHYAPEWAVVCESTASRHVLAAPQQG
jgi:hypothetical protein